MKDKIDLTVVIPTNRIQYLEEAINSVLTQKRKKCSILVVDDCAPVSIRSHLGSRFPDVIFVRHKKNRGLPASRNTGVKFVKTKYVCFLDCDDLLKPEFAKEMIVACQSSNAGAVTCLPHFFFSPDFPLKRKIIFFLLNSIRDSALLTSFWLNKKTLPKDGFFLTQFSHVLFRKDVLDRFPSDENYLTAANDWKLMAQILANEKVVILPKRLSRYRYHHKSQSQTKNKIPRWNYYDKLLKEIPDVCKKGLLFNLFRLYNFLGKRMLPS